MLVLTGSLGNQLSLMVLVKSQCLELGVIKLDRHWETL